MTDRYHIGQLICIATKTIVGVFGKVMWGRDMR